MARIIVIEDNPVFCDYVCNYIAEKTDIPTEKTYRLSQARKLIACTAEDDIVLADLRLPDGESTELLRWMRENDHLQPFIMMTDYAEVHTAVEAMKLGAEDYVPKRLLTDKLLPVLRKVQKEHHPVPHSTRIFERTGESFSKIRHRIKLVSATDITVLILGENGTGKEHIAEMIHAQSRRAHKPFIAVDCGSLSAALSPSAFFGHVKGAFTGASDHKTGYFQEAKGGTLFLDEVGNLPMETQQMLLRALQERRYRPVGAKEDKSSDIRIIAATNENLSAAIEEKRFRQDLFFRLQEFTIQIPPLRDCREDILPLAEFFLHASNTELQKLVKGFDASARKALLAYPWPGNVRELKQRVQTAVLLTEGEIVSAGALELEKQPYAPPVCYSLKDENLEKERIRQALEQAGGNRKMAAELLEVSRTTLYKKLEQYNISQKAEDS